MLRFLNAGESHGPLEIAILEGIPAGLPILTEEIQMDLNKRSQGAGRGGRGFIEKDNIKIYSGIRNGETLGSPIAIGIENMDYSNWIDTMLIDEIQVNSLDKVKITTPRPGHADLAGMMKYGFTDIRNVLERSSARETVTRVAIGAVCRKLLSCFGIAVASHTTAIGEISMNDQIYTFDKIRDSFLKDSKTRCIDKIKSKKMQDRIVLAIKDKDTLGGAVEVIAHNVPAGLGSHVHWDRKLDGIIAQSILSIQSVKALEFGHSIKGAMQNGSEFHDVISYKHGNYKRMTNNAGGIEGGMSNGEDISIKAYLKPISTLGQPLSSVNTVTKVIQPAHFERSDVCVVPRAGIVLEAAVLFAIASCFLEKFGGDNIVDIKHSFEFYMERINI
jgi:chorismate synthase